MAMKFVKKELNGESFGRITDRLDDFPKKVARFVQSESNKLKRDIQKTWFKGRSANRGLVSRWGKMRNSWRVETVKRQSSVRVRLYSKSPIAASFLTRQTIKAKTGKWLTIPVNDALTPTGRKRYKSARNHPDKLQFIKLGPKTAILVKKRGKRTDPFSKTQYVLKKQITRKAYLRGLDGYINRGLTAILQRATKL